MRERTITFLTTFKRKRALRFDESDDDGDTHVFNKNDEDGDIHVFDEGNKEYNSHVFDEGYAVIITSLMRVMRKGAIMFWRC